MQTAVTMVATLSALPLSPTPLRALPPVPATAAEMSILLAAAARAPSADNSQPWELEARGSMIWVTFDAERARSGRLGHVAGMMAVGALLESLDVAAANLGLRTIAAKGNCGVLGVQVVREPGQTSDLAAALLERCTNRSLYESTPLPWATLQAIAGENGSDGEGDARLFMTSDPRRRASIAGAAAMAERVRFDELPMADLHRWLRFSAEQAQATRDGLDVRLLGLDPVQTMALRMSGTRLGSSALRAFGATRLVARRAEQEVLASGGLGLVTAPLAAADSPRTESALTDSGRVMMRAWLRATRLGLAFAPTAAATLIPVSRHFGATFRPSVEAALDAVDFTLRAAFKVPQGHHPLFLFRVGSPTSVPSLRSERRPSGAGVSR